MNRITFPYAALLAAGFVSPVMAEEYVKQYSVTGRPTVHVNVDDGRVHVTTSDSPQVEFRVKYEGYTLDRNLSIDSSQQGNSVELRARIKPGLTIGLNMKRLSTEVRMPKDADLQLETGDGDVEVASVNGTVTLQSGDGRLKVSQLSGTIDLHTGDGAISAESLKGSIRLRTGDGSIDASNIDGKLDATTGDGPIRLSGRFDDLDIRSGDGSVSARVASGSSMASNWNIHTGDGAVDLTLPADFKANLEATTSDGHITLGLPVTVDGQVSTSRVVGKMNGGGGALKIRSGDGSIRLHASS
jgi:DUF4097 and DUF4098 domain-containing protein YvlB